MSDVHEVAKRRSHGRIGTVLKDKWRVDARLGTGGMAAVYSATHHRNGNRVALKVLHFELSQDPDTRKRFLREGYVANAVNHPGVVRVLDDDTTDDGCAFLVLELLEGESLEARRERLGGALPVHEVLSIGDRLLDVLAAAHDQKIVHRDVKPENIFLTNEGGIKLLDFGIAQMREAAMEQTRTGVMLGTPDYMSPEQAGGRTMELDARSDIYAAGATLFTLCSGKKVHTGGNIRDQLFAVTTTRARSLAVVCPNVPMPLVRVVDRALELEMQDRWPDARTMLDALRQAGQAMRVDSNNLKLAAEPISRTSGIRSPISSAPLTPMMSTQPHVETSEAARPISVTFEDDPPGAMIVPAPSSDDLTVMRAPPAELVEATLSNTKPHPVVVLGAGTPQAPSGPAHTPSHGHGGSFVKSDESVSRAVPAKPRGFAWTLVLLILFGFAAGGVGFVFYKWKGGTLHWPATKAPAAVTVSASPVVALPSPSVPVESPPVESPPVESTPVESTADADVP